MATSRNGHRAPSAGAPLLEAALDYARRGFHVFPLHTPLGGSEVCTCRNVDCPKPGKHPRTRNGFKDATTDATQITKWWDTWPDANIGVATGGRSRLFVLDGDPRNGSAASFPKLGMMPDTPWVKTGGGGWHYWLLAPEPAPRCKQNALPGIDIKCEGGYVVAPPSLHESGERYCWLVTLDEAERAPTPQSVIEILARPKPKVQAGAIAEGERNTSLFRFGCSLRRRGAESVELSAALHERNAVDCIPPLDHGEVDRVVDSVLRYPPGSAGSDDLDIGSLVLTDKSFGRILVQRHGVNIHHVPQWKQWCSWGGKRWRTDHLSQAEQYATETQEWIRGEIERAMAKASGDELERLEKLWGKAVRYEAVPARQRGLQSASWEPGVPVLVDELDRHPLLLNVQNGTLDLESLKLRPHSRSDLLTKLAAVEFDPKARCPLFDRFMEEMLPDEELRRFVQRLYGYSLLGEVRDHVLVFLHGDGRNGKSTLLKALTGPLGSDYGGAGPPKLLVKRSHDQHLTEIASLYGKRMVFCSETGEHAQFDEEKAKGLTGGDRLAARRMREDLWEFDPSHTIWLQSNYQPRVSGTDEGIWRRLLLIPFDVQPQKEDQELSKKLLAEGAGILNFGIEGLRSYHEVGLAVPESVREATAQYRQSQDSIGRFLDERVKQHPGRADLKVPGSEMFRVYAKWCEQEGESKRSRTAFGRDLGARGYEKVTSNGVKYIGVELLR